LLAPSKTPIEIVKKINLEIQHIIQTKDVTDKYISLGAESMLLSPSQFDAFINSEYYSLGKVMKKSASKSY
jgi:tripartite-type tricarboxylate transporter receptor subunit TctC